MSRVSREHQLCLLSSLVEMTSVECPAPDGYRRLQMNDIAVGMSVIYVSIKDGQNRHTTVECDEPWDGPNGKCIRLGNRSTALISRTFVPITEEPPASITEPAAAVGAGESEAAAAAVAGTGAAAAAVGAGAGVAAAAAAAVGAGAGQAAAAAAVGTGTGQAAAASAVGMDVDFSESDMEGANTFLKNGVATWIGSMEICAQEKGITLPEVLNEKLQSFLTAEGGEPLASSFHDLVIYHMRQAVPWKTGYVNFMSVPRSAKKGVIHVSMLAFERAAYAGFGMFVGDAKVLLEGEGLEGLQRKTIAIKPRAGAKLVDLGWEADGAVVNSTYAFALTCIVTYSIINNVALPQPLAHFLQEIPVQFTKFKDNQGRVLQSMVDSAVQRHANRTVQCPVFLAEELGRMVFQPQYVKQFVKLYQQRMSITPHLLMPQKIEDCVVRLMSPGKTCQTATKLLAAAVIKFTWPEGPWTVSHLLSPYFSIGSSLNDSMVEVWAKENTQSAKGQSLALQIGNDTFDKTARRLSLDMEWPRALVACGLWVQIKESILPKLMLNPDTIMSLERTLMTDENFRKDMSTMSAKDPPATTSAVGDLATWVLQHLSEVKRAKELQDEAARSSAEAHPSKILGDAEAKELAAYNYASSCALDVDSYRKAIAKFGENNTALDTQWKDLHEKFTSNLLRLHASLQQSDVVFWEPPKRAGLRKNKEWLSVAATAAMAHRRKLKTILGVGEDQICQVNVFALYTLGTVKKNMLADIAKVLPALGGISVIFSSDPQQIETPDSGRRSLWREC